MEARVLELEKAVNDTSMKEKVAAMEAKVLDIKRADTERDFSNLKTPTKKSCAVCSKTFLTNAQLEKHMNKRHDDCRNFECTVSGKKFFLEWRLKKHAQMHTVIPRTCRYFSNKMPCPFEEIGCKFSHTIPLQPATRHVDVRGHEEQPGPQLYNDVNGHADQPHHYHHAALQGHEEQPPQHFHAPQHRREEQQTQLYHEPLHGREEQQPQLYQFHPSFMLN